MVVLLPFIAAGAVLGVAACGGYGIAAAGLKAKDALEMRGFGEHVEKNVDIFCDNIRKSVPQWKACDDVEAYRKKLMGDA